LTDRHSINSSLREHIVEHVFVGEALRRLWQHGIVNVEVLRSEFDAHGYDLVLARGNIVRHIQLKTGLAKRPGDVSVPMSLAEKPSGCVIWISVTEKLDLGPYLVRNDRNLTCAADTSTESLPTENRETPSDSFHGRFRLTRRLSNIVSGQAPEGNNGSSLSGRFEISYGRSI
jgi:hypothetical protein